MNDRLSPHRLREINKADPTRLDALLRLDGYWSDEALRKVLSRIERLMLDGENPEALLETAERVARAIELLPRPADLVAMSLAVKGSVKRLNGDYDGAVETFETALSIGGVTRATRGRVLCRMVTAALLSRRVELAQSVANEAVALSAPGIFRIEALSVRAWSRATTGDLAGCLKDCCSILNRPHALKRKDDEQFRICMMSAITSACNVLALENDDAEKESSLLSHLETAIKAARKTLPNNGSGFYFKARLPRVFLARAEALVFFKTGRAASAVTPLTRCAEVLLELDHADDALTVHLDLIKVLTKLDRIDDARKVAAKALEIFERGDFGIQIDGVLGKGLRNAANPKHRLDYPLAVELRCMFRLQISEQRSVA